MAIDLHTHSTFSDGTMSPSELIALAKARKLRGIAITDHDTAEGTREAFAAGKTFGVEVVSGIELSVLFGSHHLHLLGYCFDPDDAALSRELTAIQRSRIERNEEILKKLQGFGLEVSREEVAGKSLRGQTGRPHIAQVMVDKGIVRSMDQAFSEYLQRGAPAHVPRKVLEVGNAIELIRGAGGIAVLAHPATIDSSLASIPELVGKLVVAGLEGIEAFYPTHSRKNQKQLNNIAQRYDLVVTGGSDYHGDIRPGTTLAGGSKVHVPYILLDRLKERCSR